MVKKLMKYRVNKGYIFSRTRKNTFMMLFWALVLFALYIWYMSSGLAYFLNAFSSGYDFRMEKFTADSKIYTIEPQQEDYDTSAGIVTIPPMLRLDEVYRDGLHYRFKLEIESYTEVGIAYTIGEDSCLQIVRYSPEAGNIPAGAVQKVAVVRMNGLNVAALLPPEETMVPGETVTYACLSELQMYLGHDLGTTEFAGAEMSSYCIDLRYLTVDDEIVDFALVIIFSILFPLFLLYTLFLLIKPQFHPNYLRINKFGDINRICGEIDDEINEESNHKEGRELYTKHYIIYQSMHATKVKMNHLIKN